MARVTSGRGNAHAHQTSLTSLLALPKPSPSVSPTISLLRAMAEQKSHELQRQTVRLTSDARQYHPARRNREPGRLITSATALHIGRTAKGVYRGKLPHAVSFRVPNYVSLCVRRKIRREVYLALNKGKSRGSGSKRRRNPWSDIKC